MHTSRTRHNRDYIKAVEKKTQPELGQFMVDSADTCEAQLECEKWLLLAHCPKVYIVIEYSSENNTLQVP